MPEKTLPGIHIDRASGTPVYEQLYEQIRRRIYDGSLPAGFRFPSEKNLSLALGINHLTLRKALARLKEEGLISAKPKVGTVVCDPSMRRTSEENLNVGVICWNEGGFTAMNAYSRRILTETLAVGASLGMTLHKICAAEMDEKTLQKETAAKEIQGVVSFPFMTRPHRALFRELPVPKVLLELRDRFPQTDNIVVDSFPGVEQGVEVLLSRGHRRVAYVGGLLENKDPSNPLEWIVPQDSPDRLAAIRRTLQDKGVSFTLENVFEIPYSQEDADKLVGEWLHSSSLPSAVVAFDDHLAVLLYRAFRAEGVEVPNDVSLLGFGNSMPETLNGKIATVVVDWEAMGALAIRRIKERIRDGVIPEITIPVTSAFKNGRSIGSIEGTDAARSK